MARRRLLYAITRAEYGGAQTHVADLLRAFRDRHELALAIGEEGFLTDFARDQGIPVFMLPHLVQPIRPAQDLLALREFLSLLARWSPDLIHAHSSKAGLIARIAARLRGIPAIYTAHGWGFSHGVSPLRKGLVLPMELVAARLSERILPVSHYDRDLAIRYRVAPAERMQVIHNGIPDHPERAVPGEATVANVVMVARFAQQKDHALLLRALARVRAPFRLKLVGDGPLLPQARSLAHEHGLADRVEFLGARADVPQVLASCHVFVLTSLWEGFPISILEGMRAGLPIVASDVGGVREAVADDETGYLVARGDEATLRDRLESLLLDAELRQRMGLAARRRFEGEFTVDHMIRQLEQVYSGQPMPVGVPA
jgi:glycosyltransferase involved in cell wall biosynthesis